MSSSSGPSASVSESGKNLLLVGTGGEEGAEIERCSGDITLEEEQAGAWEEIGERCSGDITLEEEQAGAWEEIGAVCCPDDITLSRVEQAGAWEDEEGVCCPDDITLSKEEEQAGA